MANFGWSGKETAAFAAARQAIARAVTVAHLDPLQAFCLFTDASMSHWAAVLTQIPEDELQLPVEEQSHEPLAFLSGAFRGHGES